MLSILTKTARFYSTAPQTVVFQATQHTFANASYFALISQTLFFGSVVYNLSFDNELESLAPLFPIGAIVPLLFYFGMRNRVKSIGILPGNKVLVQNYLPFNSSKTFKAGELSSLTKPPQDFLTLRFGDRTMLLDARNAVLDEKLFNKTFRSCPAD